MRVYTIKNHDGDIETIFADSVSIEEGIVMFYKVIKTDGPIAMFSTCNIKSMTSVTMKAYCQSKRE